MADPFKPYVGSKGTIVVAFNDGKVTMGQLVKYEDGYLMISGNEDAIGGTNYVPWPNSTVKYFFFKKPDQ